MEKDYSINWNSFKAKFGGKEQLEFERLSYILFCLEYDEKFGIFRYKNQAGIETNPIEKNGNIIGFQAKFYDTKISSNVSDIKDSIQKAKNKNNDLNKILFYLNQEFGESSNKTQQKPEYQIDIETYANDIGIIIDWRVPSHFEKQLIEPKNHWLYEIFFSLDKGLLDFINEIEVHTNSILNPIRTEITWSENTLKIDRTSHIEKILESLKNNQSIVLSGVGGGGKTALIKDISLELNYPFFVFKARELGDLKNINELFANYGNCKFSDFIKTFENELLKIVVIDSAENISDSENMDVFFEFITELMANNWKVIFTTRYSYFNDLNFLLANNFNLVPVSIDVDNLSEEELKNYAKQYNFLVPNNQKLRAMLLIPFYLSYYLKQYSGDELDFENFKERLWQEKIQNSAHKKANLHIRREETFLEIITKRVEQNSFLVKLNQPDHEALCELAKDEIIQYDANSKAWFITHDIYEEWALDKYIEAKYIESSNPLNFIESIGNYLPVRRAFRIWLSNKLDENNIGIKELISNLLSDNQVTTFWKDEILVSVLQSEYSGSFFKLFKDDLLGNNQEFLVRVIFILRIACKDIDSETMRLLALSNDDWTKLKYVFTIPKGAGWDDAIKFIFENLNNIDSKHLNNILNLLVDWTQKNPNGITTNYAGKICLYYYEKMDPHRDTEKILIQIILNSAFEIKEDIEKILDDVTYNSRDKYYELASTILASPFESIQVIKHLSTKVFEIARKFWLEDKTQKDEYPFGRHEDIENYFGLETHCSDYHPASSFQTPIYFLLKTAPFETLDFIISFINETTKNYSDSDLDCANKTKVKMYINEEIIEQFASARLWETYRKTHVVPDVLESIHMALEKWLLEITESSNLDNLEYLEKIFIKLLKESNSVSITSVIASAICAYPDKLYKVAKILFKTKEFFQLDLHRKIKDFNQFEFFTPFDNKIFVNERKKSNKLKHREKSLEDIALYYQAFEVENPIVDIETRRKELGEIWNKYYSEFPSVEQQTDEDRDFRFTLNRIDYRKMEVTTKQLENNQVLIAFGTEPAPDLKKISEKHNKEIKEEYKYLNLNIWANKRFKREKIEESNIYQNNIELVFKESKEVFQNLGHSETFDLLYHSTPAYVFAVLLRDYNEDLSQEKKDYCKDVLVHYASLPLNESYYYQINDGTWPSIISLKNIIELFPQEINNIKLLLLSLLLKGDKTKDLASGCILSIWDNNFQIAQELFFAYLKYKPKYKEMQNKIWHLRYDNKEKEIKNEYKNFKKKLTEIDWSKLSYIKGAENLSPEILSTAFTLLPNGSTHPIHKDFILKCFSAFADVIFNEEREQKSNLIHVIYGFLNKFAYFLLGLPKDEIHQYLKSFIDKFNNNDDYTAKIFIEISVAQDALRENDKFWHIWDIFYSKISDLANADWQRYKNQEIIINYLLADRIIGLQNVTEWHTIQQENIPFYYSVAKDMGKNENVLYSLSKVFNDIAFNYLDDGFNIISYCIENNDYSNKEINAETIHYIENIIRRFILSNRQILKTNKVTKDKAIKILDFLIERGSVFAYMLRESIL